MARKTLAELYGRLPIRPSDAPEDRKVDLCAQVIWVEAAMSVLGTLAEVQSLDQLPAVLWSLHAEARAMHRAIIEEAQSLYTPLELFRAELSAMQAKRRNGGA